MSVRTTVSASRPVAVTADVLVVPVWSSGQVARQVPVVLQRTMRRLVRQLSFTGRWGAAELFPLAGRGVAAPFMAVIGLGEKNADRQRVAEGMRRGMGRVVQEARRHNLRHLAVALAGLNVAPETLAGAVVDGVELTSYRFVEYSDRARKESVARNLRQVSLLVGREQVRAVRRVVQEEQVVLAGVSLARDLVNRPASVVTAKILADVARDICKSSRQISLKVLGKREAEKEGFNAFLSVARGSQEEPYVIHLVYTPPRRSDQLAKKVFLVGKGITFDSGGLSLKPAEGMESMKIDMAGAASVLGVFSILPKLRPDVEVHGVIAACENMPSGEAYRPGDVLTAKNGKTIEVLNTDAEGRVTLADALGYAVEHKPDAVIDLATLTGSCIVALGETHAGLWGTDDALCKRLLNAARTVGEGLVRLPLPDEYKPMIESRVADVRNTSTTKWGGAITAALFLREFVGGVPWAHIDLAGPAYAEREWLSYNTPGATGFGVRMLVEFLKKHSAQN